MDSLETGEEGVHHLEILEMFSLFECWLSICLPYTSFSCTQYNKLESFSEIDVKC